MYGKFLVPIQRVEINGKGLWESAMDSMDLTLFAKDLELSSRREYDFISAFGDDKYQKQCCF